jgi:hypothetical protein
MSSLMPWSEPAARLVFCRVYGGVSRRATHSVCPPIPQRRNFQRLPSMIWGQYVPPKLFRDRSGNHEATSAEVITSSAESVIAPVSSVDYASPSRV